jgi:hypothetical protein
MKLRICWLFAIAALVFCCFAGAQALQVRAVPSLLPHRHLFRSLSTMRLLLILQHARKKIFVSNNTDKKNIVSDKCHKLSFYFLHI